MRFRKTIPGRRGLAVLLGLLLMYFRAAAASIQPPLPAEAGMNKGAGRGGHLIVTLRLESGEELPFVVDTGSSVTFINEALAPKLGTRIETVTFRSFGREQESGVYAAPKLYLGTTLLQRTDTHIYTWHFKQRSSQVHPPIMGLLGMDCLRNYCIQLDFAAGKMRFLEPGKANAGELGKAFPLTYSTEGLVEGSILPYLHHAGLLGGAGTNLLIDTGYNVDGIVEKGTIRGHFLARAAHLFVKSRGIRVPESIWDGESYTRLIVGQGEQANLLGLRFLGRHLVTFDFPRGTLYLKRMSSGPLANDDMSEDNRSRK